MKFFPWIKEITIYFIVSAIVSSAFSIGFIILAILFYFITDPSFSQCKSEFSEKNASSKVNPDQSKKIVNDNVVEKQTNKLQPFTYYRESEAEFKKFRGREFYIAGNLLFKHKLWAQAIVCYQKSLNFGYDTAEIIINLNYAKSSLNGIFEIMDESLGNSFYDF